MMQGEAIAPAKTSEIFILDPRTKIFLMFIVNAAIFTSSRWYVMALFAALVISLLFLSGKAKAGLICSALYLASLLANMYLVDVFPSAINIIVVMMSGIIYRMLPMFILGYYLVKTTTVSEFIASMERMHMPKQIIIPVSVMFRFFPTINEEATSINNAMRMRGVTFKNPVATLEYRIVPLLLATIKISDELSAASLTRGLGCDIKRTNVCQIGFKAWDVFYVSLAIIGYIGFVL